MANERKRIGISVGTLLLVLLVIIVLVIVGVTLAKKASKGAKNVENQVVNEEVEDNNLEVAKIKTDAPKKQQEIVEGSNYKHTAVRGCIITVDDQETGEVTYKEMCDICGEVSNEIKTVTITDPDYTSAFYCSNCKQTQTVEIATEINN